MEQRDPSFWRAVIDHPEVKPHVTLGREFDVGPLIASSRVLPLASENGGFLLVQLDGLGRVFELHTMYRPEGWGREVLTASKAMFRQMFERCDLIVTHEVFGWWRSRPPKSFGFRPAGEFRPEYGTQLRTWTLTRDDWEKSPARRRG